MAHINPAETPVDDVAPAPGRLTAELFESAGVAVSWQPVPAGDHGAGKIAEPPVHVNPDPHELDRPTHQTCIKCAQVALQRIGARAESDREWSDWVAVGHALMLGRIIAMREAGTNQPTGRKYCVAVGKWLRCWGFDQVDKSDRAHLIRCIENLDAIETWRRKLPLTARLALNHPSAVWRKWCAATRTPNLSEPTSSAEAGIAEAGITVAAVLDWLATASPEDRQLVCEALSADTRSLLKMLPAAKRDELARLVLGLVASQVRPKARAEIRQLQRKPHYDIELKAKPTA